MKSTAYVTHSDCSRHDTGWGHPEHQGRLPAVARAVYRDMLTLFEPLLEVEARPADLADLLLAHDASYVGRVRERVEEAARRGEVLELEGGTPVSAASWDAAVAAVGAALTAVDAVMRGSVRNAFCAVRPPGHGIGRAGGGGFGLFNPVAAAARDLRARRALPAVLVVEWGDQAGRGTAEILAGDRGVRFVTVHRAPLPPAPAWPDGAIPLPLPAGAGAPEFRQALQAGLRSATADFTPHFLLLSLGCDALASDPRGGMALQPADYHTLTVDLLRFAGAHCGGRLVSVLEEGYDPAGMGAAVVQHLRALADLPPA